MARLPTPGQDDNQWGDILNEFLGNEHNADGSQKPLPQSKVIDLTTDIAAKEDKSAKGAAGGYTPLDSNSKVPATYLPAASAADQAAGVASLRTLGYGANQAAQGSAVDVRMQPLEAGTGITTKRAAYSCGIPTIVQTGVGTEAVQRQEVTVPVATQRWRLHIRNWVPHTGQVAAGSIAFNGAWVGPAAFQGPGGSVGQSLGDFSAAPTQALTAFTTPSDGSEYISTWVTDAGAQFAPFTPFLLSMGWTGPTSQARMSGGARAFYKQGAGVSAQAGQQAVSGGIASTVTTTMFDIWIEYEFVGMQSIGFALGDSLTAGFTNASQNPAGVPLPDTWPHAYGLLSGCAMINAGVSGAGAANFLLPGNGIYTKWGFGGSGLTVPDFAIVWLGINDATGQQPASSVDGYYQKIVDNLRLLGIKRIYLVVLPPFGAPFGFIHGTLIAPTVAGATSLQTSTAFSASDNVVLDYGMGTREQVQVSAGGSTGTGPYLTPVSALAQAHTAGAQIWTTREASRRDYNAYLRSVPYGVQGIIDFEAVIASPTDPFIVDPSIASVDLGHLSIEGYSRCAHAVPARLTVPT